MVRVIIGLGAINPTNITHELVVQRANGQYPPIMRTTNDGRFAIGFNNLVNSSFFNVGAGFTHFSVDELASTRYNGSVNGTGSGIAGAGACIGFNAARQSDAAIACESNGTRNGGGLIWAGGDGSLNFTPLPNNGGLSGNGTGVQYFYPQEILNRRVVSIRSSGVGQMQVGPMGPQTGSTHADYRLAVDGKLVAKSVFVTQAAANWADFVFEPGYQSMSLPALEAYLKTNRHLPAVPPAAEVARTGIDLGAMDARLLQGLEELTLHVIELNKQNERLRAQVTALAATVQQLTPPASQPATSKQN